MAEEYGMRWDETKREMTFMCGGCGGHFTIHRQDGQPTFLADCPHCQQANGLSRLTEAALAAALEHGGAAQE